MPIDKSKLRPARPLNEIFEMGDCVFMEGELNAHCLQKSLGNELPLTEAEQTYEWLSRMGTMIAGDGFVSLFCQFFTPDSFPKICDALTEVRAVRLRKLLVEAWSIYTKDKTPITLDELQRISIMRFNTKEKMDRFDEIGGEVEAILQKQYDVRKVYAVEYAKRHRAEFMPIVK